MKDPIVEEARKTRREHAARFNFDLAAIGAELKKKEKEWRSPVVTLPPRKRLQTTAGLTGLREGPES